MNKFIFRSALIAALLSSSPAMAATFVNIGDSFNINFDGTQPGTSANLVLKLTGVNSDENIFMFSYTLDNTSNAQNPTARVTSFGFDDDTDLSGEFSTGAGDFFDVVSLDDNFPNDLDNREFCVTAKNCLGGKLGVTSGMDPVTGQLVFDYEGTGLDRITLDNFAVRYISTGTDGEGSGTGVGIVSPVPEPATWMMMLVGFAGVGFSMRRKAKITTRVQFA